MPASITSVLEVEVWGEIPMVVPAVMAAVEDLVLLRGHLAVELEGGREAVEVCAVAVLVEASYLGTAPMAS